MVKFEHSIVINRPVDEVFAFVTNPENDPLWIQSTQKAKQTSDGPMGVGATLSSQSRFLGRNVESAVVVTEYELNRKRTGKTTSGPIPAELSSIFEPVEGGTKVTSIGQMEIGGFFKLAEPVVGRMVSRQVEGDLANLKDLLESTG